MWVGGTVSTNSKRQWSGLLLSRTLFAWIKPVQWNLSMWETMEKWEGFSPCLPQPSGEA